MFEVKTIRTNVTTKSFDTLAEAFNEVVNNYYDEYCARYIIQRHNDGTSTTIQFKCEGSTVKQRIDTFKWLTIKPV